MQHHSTQDTEELIPLTGPALKAAGLGYPRTLGQANWMFRTRQENGFADAFVKIGKRRFLMRSRYLRLLEARAAERGYRSDAQR
ncbi:MAG: hypothetical protein AMXMBFR8_26820 [Nevskiales bacterium]